MKKEINIWLAVATLLAFGGLIFISVNGTRDTYMDNQEKVKGAANAAREGDTVAVVYSGRLEDGTVFDSNLDPQFGHMEPLIFTIGAGEVIPGWEKGIVGMQIGEKKTLTVPPSEAYGEAGVPGVIPPNATLIFDVELLAIKNSQ